MKEKYIQITELTGLCSITCISMHRNNICPSGVKIMCESIFHANVEMKFYCSNFSTRLILSSFPESSMMCKYQTHWICVRLCTVVHFITLFYFTSCSDNKFNNNKNKFIYYQHDVQQNALKLSPNDIERNSVWV
jgi:hypothetical protein